MRLVIEAIREKSFVYSQSVKYTKILERENVLSRIVVVEGQTGIASQKIARSGTL